MTMMDFVKRLLGNKRKTIAAIEPDELRRERIRIEQEESRLIKKVEEIEKDKEALFAKGAEEPSQRQQLIIARKIKELDQRAHNHDRSLRLLSRQLRVVTGFIHIKESKALLEKTATSSLLARMDLADLQRYVEAATVEGQFQMAKFENILGTLEDYDIEAAAAEDADTLAIVEAMNRARAAKEADPEAAIKEGVKEVETILRREEEEEATT